MRTFWIVLLLLLVVAGAAAFWFLGQGGMTLRVSQAELQTRLDERFPIVKDGLLGEIRLSEPRVGLSSATKRVSVDFSLAGNSFLTGEIEGRGVLSGELRYDSPEASLYLDRPEIDLELIDGDEDRREAIEAAATALASSYFSDHPIHTVDDADLRSRLTREYLRELLVENDGLVLRFGTESPDES